MQVHTRAIAIIALHIASRIPVYKRALQRRAASGFAKGASAESQEKMNEADSSKEKDNGKRETGAATVRAPRWRGKGGKATRKILV